MKTAIRSLLIGLGIFTVNLTHAQDADLTATNIDWSTAADWQVALQEIEQMPPMPALDATNGNTFYSAQHAEGTAEPWPPLPGNVLNLPAWSLGDNDGQQDYLLDDLGFNYHTLKRHKAASQTLSISVGGMTMSADDDPALPGDGDGSTNNYGSAGLLEGLSPDYGTNLYIAQMSQSEGMYSGIISNTIFQVPYEIQYSYDLLSTNWQSADWIFPGSEVTNWTTFSVPMTSSSNMFFRVRSWQSEDDSGLPTWWEEEYFGTNNVNPYGDPAGDGWNNLEKFQNGMNPNIFYTPPAPQDVTSSYNPSTGLVTVDWLASPGPVTGYTVNINGTIIPVSAGSTSVQNNISEDDAGYYPTFFGPNTYYGSISVVANYTGGNSSEGSASLQSMIDYPNYYVGYLTSGQQGQAYLTVPAFPSGTVAMQITRADEYAEAQGDYSFDTTVVIPVSAFTNGVAVLPAPLSGVCPVDSYGESDYYWWIATVDAHGNASGATRVGFGYSDDGSSSYNDYSGSSSEWPAEPWFDGREQLKQNLMFLLRAGLNDQPFSFTGVYTNVGQVTYTYPTNYAYASFYEFGNSGGSTANGIGVFLPFGENYLYDNFIFNPSDLNSDGGLPSFYPVSDIFNLLGLEEPPFNSFNPPIVSGTAIAPVLATNGCIYSSLPYLDYGNGTAPTIGIVEDGTTNEMVSGYKNTFGLQFLSTEVAWGSSGSDTATLYPGDWTTQSGTLYASNAEPQLETIEYDFWNTSGYELSSTNLVPGMPGFSTAASSQLLVAGVGQQYFRVAAYAKEALLNGYAGAYGYLGQYFTNAYQIDDNGNVTTNQTGILSPYGDFFPTYPGPTALVTMPDPDTGVQGTTTVYCVSLALDANHDGNMDLNFGGTDATSQSSPYVFWCNNNFDRWDYDSDDNTNYMDDVQEGDNSDASQNLDPYDADCNYNVNGYRYIPSTRDLEDFARLWVCGVTSNLLAALPTNSTVTLSWSGISSGSPTIDLFQAADTNGGIGYLTNETVATAQIDPLAGDYIERLGPGDSIQLNAEHFGSYWRGNYFIWCGVSNGTGGLTLTIADGNGNVLAQNTAYIQIEDIKNMYERWTVGDEPTNPPLDEATNATDYLPGPVYQPFQYPLPQSTNTPYILLVHGWNDSPWDKDHFAETALKRLYWQGYQGRFGSFRWPTDYGFTGTWEQLLANPVEKDNYDSSEYQAWQSGAGLLNLLTRLNSEYPSQVYLLAHSMGNVVAGEALRLAGTNQVVNTYVVSQGAVTAHAYDDTLPNGLFTSISPTTPNIYGDWFLSNNGGGAGQIINFYNTNDYALSIGHWGLDEQLKPDKVVLEGSATWYYAYAGSADDSSPWNKFFKESESTTVNFDIVNNLLNRYEVMGYAAQAYTTALGATPAVLNVILNVDLTRTTPSGIWPPDPTGKGYIEHFWHSAEFRGDDALMGGYWNELLSSEAFGIK